MMFTDQQYSNQSAVADPVHDGQMEQKPFTEYEPNLLKETLQKQANPSLHKNRSAVDFGQEFAKRNKNATKNLESPCAVTIHDYGASRYEINGFDLSRSGEIPNKDQRFSDPESMLKALPVLGKEKPEWATVRYASSHDGVKVLGLIMYQVDRCRGIQCEDTTGYFRHSPQTSKNVMTLQLSLLPRTANFPRVIGHF